MDALRTAAAAAPFVQVAGVTKTFPVPGGAIRALDRIDLEVHEGEFVAVVGPSGCGKSTLLAVLAGLERPTAGEVRIAGRPVTAPYTDLGIVFQKDLLLEWRTVLSNVMLQAELRRLDARLFQRRAVDLLERAGLAGFEGRYPSELSGGMRQRVAVCRALLHDPPLLLMDEPFGALDALTRDQMALDMQALFHAQRKTVLLITHSIPEAVFLADTVVVCSPRPGRIVRRLPIRLPRPRRLADRAAAEFTAYEAEIRDIFGRQGVLRER